jgi:hypothetical protein
MIRGCKHWESRKITRYVQTNNAVEQILKKSGVKNWLESCNLESATMIIAAMGHDIDVQTPGGATIQPADAAILWANDPANYEKLKGARNLDGDRWMGNEIPQWIPVIVHEVFGVKAQYEIPLSWKQLTEFLVGSHGVELHLVNPGHFIAALAYDDETNEIIYNDPWPGRRGLKNRGFHERMSEHEFSMNYSKYGIVFFEG